MNQKKTIWPAGESEEMQAATDNARKTFKYFWRELSWEYRRIVPGLDISAVKVAFATDDDSGNAPSFEHMWVGEIQFDGQTISGKLLNQPQWTSSMNQGDPVTVPPEEIGDWMYACLGDVCGGYTIDVMRAGMSAKERQEHDKAWGLKFPEPGNVQIVPPAKEAKKGLISGLFSKSKTNAAGGDLPEHPMSENMVEKWEAQLKGDPAIANFLDGAGWSLLQRDALAGNYSPAALLLKYGADASARNPHGLSALDLAKKMGWPRIIALLEGR